MQRISIMQGRLSPRPFSQVKMFPIDSWENEFRLASLCEFYSIEWILGFNYLDHNPLLSKSGRNKIIATASDTGVNVKSLCVDYFMEKPLFKGSHEERKQNIAFLMELIRYSCEIGVETILLPVLENAELKTSDDRALLLYALDGCLPVLKEHGVKIGIESELPANEYLALVLELNSPFVGVYYDTGNGAARGYDMKEDFYILADKLINIHLKDRPISGKNTYLGEGAANFIEGIPFIESLNFNGLYVLESYFGDDFFNDAKRNKEYINRILGGKQ